MRRTKQPQSIEQTVRTPRVWQLGKVRHLALPLLVLAGLLVAGCGASQKPDSVTPAEITAEIIPKEGKPTSYGMPLSMNNTQLLIDYYDTITLTAEQDSIKRDALQALRAPCCDDNTMDVC